MSRYFQASHIAATFGITLSQRYLRFLDKERPSVGRTFAVLPSYEGAMPVAFDGAPLESFFRGDLEEETDQDHPSADEAELGGAGGWIPLATIGVEEPQFLVVRAAEEPCPVAMWEHETGDYVLCSSTLDAFLASLGKTAKAAKRPKAKVDLDKVRALIDKLDDVLKLPTSARRTKDLEAGLAKLEPMLVAMPPTLTMDPDDATVPGMAHYTRGLVLRALGRFEEALAALEEAQIDGRPKNVSPQTVVDLLLHDLDRPERVIEVCARHAAPTPLLRRTWALALLRLGRIEEAASHLGLIVERQVQATCKLTPATDPVAETARRKALLATAIRDYANARQLDASDLLARLE